MKQSVRLIFVLGLSMLIFLSCKKKNNAEPATVNYFMTANLGGKIWTAYSATGSLDSGILSIDGDCHDSTKIMFSLPVNLKSDTNVFKHIRDPFYYTTNSINLISFNSFVITSKTGNVISGTFEAAIYSRWGQLEMQVTNGSFRVKY